MTGPMFGKPERIYADSPTEETVPKEFSPPPKPEKQPVPKLRQLALVKPSGDRVRGTASTALEIAGIASIAVGGFLVAPWLGSSC